MRWNAVKAGRSTGKGVRISWFLLLSGTVPDDLIELKVAGHCVDDAPANFRSTLTTHLAPDFFCKFLPHPCLWLQRSKTGSLSFIVDDLMLGTGSTEVQQTHVRWSMHKQNHSVHVQGHSRRAAVRNVQQGSPINWAVSTEEEFVAFRSVIYTCIWIGREVRLEACAAASMFASRLHKATISQGNEVKSLDTTIRYSRS